MIYYWLDLVYIFIRCKLFTKRVNVETTISHYRRVGVFDCEGLRFMSNAKYPFYMDFIRYEILFRSALYRETVGKGLLPTLGSQKLIYRRPLRLGQRFKLTLSLEGWEGGWAYHKQVFTRNGQVYAIGYTKVAFLKERKPQDMETIIRNCGYEGPQRTPSEEIMTLFRGDRELLEYTSQTFRGSCQ